MLLHVTNVVQRVFQLIYFQNICSKDIEIVCIHCEPKHKPSVITAPDKCKIFTDLIIYTLRLIC